MNYLHFAAVGLGAALGAWSRWLLGLLLNPLVQGIPLGTLAANLSGGYLVGVALGLFHLHAGISPVLKLFVITGFLGGLTTFSTFSAESTERLLSGQTGMAVLMIALHLFGSLLLTFLGLATVGAIRIWS
ncbi:MAG: fluoride efflux transporter CrcB [Zoogloeaceae bacterium]|jgi:CrcB protein|nr:fluoride efflux transporter CrcB [Zoogloeaceae bacterium]